MQIVRENKENRAKMIAAGTFVRDTRHRSWIIYIQKLVRILLTIFDRAYSMLRFSVTKGVLFAFKSQHFQLYRMNFLVAQLWLHVWVLCVWKCYDLTTFVHQWCFLLFEWDWIVAKGCITIVIHVWLFWK